MAKMTKDQVEHLARLASLSLTQDEVEKYSTQLSAVLEYVEALSELNTKAVEPTHQSSGLENLLRSDEINAEQILSQEHALREAKETHNGYFKVPPVLLKDQ